MRNAIKAVAAGAAMIMMAIGASYAAPVSNNHLSGAFDGSVLQVQYGGHCERLRWGGASIKMNSARKAGVTASAIARSAADAPVIASVCGGLASTKRCAARKAKVTAAATARSADAKFTESGASAKAPAFLLTICTLKKQNPQWEIARGIARDP